MCSNFLMLDNYVTNVKLFSNFLIHIHDVMQNEDKVGNTVEETLILELLAGGGKVCVANSCLMLT